MLLHRKLRGKHGWTLETRMVWWISFLIIMVICLLGGTFYFFIQSYMEDQVGKRALGLAHTIAEIPEVKESFQQKDPSKSIQPLVEKIRKQTDAEFIVVGNKQGIRYSHPLPDRIGKTMVGGDNDQALRYGQSYVSKAVGSLGPSLRGKVPIRDEKGQVIGIVSVGILLSDIEGMSFTYFTKICLMIGIALLIGVVGARVLAKRLKKTIFGLEPEEISALYQERNAVIESVREGIIVINRRGSITVFNQSAADILGFSTLKSVIGAPVESILPTTRLRQVLQSGQEELDQEMLVNGNMIVVNRLPIRSDDGLIIGVVSSFRLKSELDQLNEELSQAKQYVEALRAQTHEFKNTLYTISGLIQLESYQEAIEMITKETDLRQDQEAWMMDKVKDPWISAILVGFYHRARELKIDFRVDRESNLQSVPISMSSSSLVHILGNLITNAFEAVQFQDEDQRKVKLFLTDLGDLLWFEIEDSGLGIKQEWISQIFEQGFSTKAVNKEKRGYGLSKVNELVRELGGFVTVDHGRWGGAVFSVALPKKEGVSL